MKTCLLILITIIITGSCATYYIHPNSLREQFAGVDSTKYIETAMIGSMPVSMILNYPANPITTIQCVDKQGNPHVLTNSPSIVIRFTYGYKNKRVVFYFDRLYVDSSSVTGVRSRLIETLRKSIPLDSITKIEIQDSRKNFKYIR